MVGVPLGVGAYKRTFGGEAEIQLINRYFETNPTNAREKMALLARCGTTKLGTFGLPNASFRASFTKRGMFDDSLFIISGTGLFRQAQDGTQTSIIGTVHGTDYVASTWMKGIGYEYLFIADAYSLQYYGGGTFATGTLTYSPGTITNQLININGLYYSWNASVETNAPTGKLSHPFLANPGSDPITAMANLLNYDGVPGTDFSAEVPGQAVGFTAQAVIPSATGVLTLSGGGITNQVFNIGNAWYSWDNNVDNNSPQGSATNPWLAALGATDAASLANMVKLINYTGVGGTDYSSIIGGASPYVTAVSTAATLTVTALTPGVAANSVPTTVYSGAFLAWGAATLAGGSATAASIVLTSTSDGADSNTIATVVVSGSYLSFGHASLQGGNSHVLNTVVVPDGDPIIALANVSGYVLAAVANSQKFFWLNPGDVTIDALNFAEKESNPDNIVDMATLGDQVVIAGGASTENWYATGDLTAPFQPIEGRVYMRGFQAGTLTVVKDSVFGIGDDGVVYEIGYQFGTTAQWGVHRVSNHGIEERIRTQMRNEEGLAP